MPNSLSALNQKTWLPMVQDYLNKRLVATEICTVKYEANLTKGASLEFPYVSDVSVQDYTQGTDMTMPAITATSSVMTIDQIKSANFVLDPVQMRQAAEDFGAAQAKQASYQLFNNIDQKVLATGIAGTSSLNTVTGGTLSTTNILGKVTDAYANLASSNATDGEMFICVDPKRAALLNLSLVANGFAEADSSLRNSFRGRIAGFDVYVTNNLPHAQSIVMPTIPVAGDSMTIMGVTINWVAAGAAAVAGDVSIGANIAASKANFLLMIAGTATGTAATYVDLVAEDRKKWSNAQLTASAWAATTADTVDLTAYNTIGATETVNPADCVVNTETLTMLAGRKGAIALGIQSQPGLVIHPEPKQLAENHMVWTLFGTKVFYRDALRLAKVTCNQ